MEFHLLYDWFNETKQPLSLKFLEQISQYTESHFLGLINLLNIHNLPTFIVLEEEDVYPDLYEQIYESEGMNGALVEELEEAQELQKSKFITFYKKKNNRT